MKEGQIRVGEIYVIKIESRKTDKVPLVVKVGENRSFR